jgi:Ca2+-binding EF-hand superfamily protein
MDQILNNEVVLNKKKNELGTVAEDSEGEYVQRLVEFVLNKIHERHKNTTHAFRFFDTKGKGKIKKIDLIEGFEKLRIKLSNEDFEKFWNHIDAQKKGKCTFNDFCALSEQKNLKTAD